MSKKPGYDWGRAFSLGQKPCAAHGKIGCRCQHDATRNRVSGKLPGHNRQAIDDIALERELRIEEEWDK